MRLVAWLSYSRPVYTIVLAMRGRIRFDWDNHNLSKIAAHGLSKFEVESALQSGFLIDVESKLVNNELRHVAIGRIPKGRAITIVSTHRQKRIRVITAYPMNREEMERHGIG